MTDTQHVNEDGALVWRAGDGGLGVSVEIVVGLEDTESLQEYSSISRTFRLRAIVPRLPPVGTGLMYDGFNLGCAYYAKVDLVTNIWTVMCKRGKNWRRSWYPDGPGTEKIPDCDLPTFLERIGFTEEERTP